MSGGRSFGRRNVFFQTDGDEKPFGGMTINPATSKITNSQLFRFLEILVVVDILDGTVAESLSGGPMYQVFLGADEIVANEDLLLPGTYSIVPYTKQVVRLRMTTECPVPRALSHSTTTGRISSFEEAVRKRDEGCAIAGTVNRGKAVGRWIGYHAAHIFPAEQGSEFIAMEGCCWITDVEESGQELNSPQNGMIMNSYADTAFNQYVLGIDVDDGYKVVPFITDDLLDSWSGNTLAEWARQNGDIGVRDALLRWHFRMCVLANMKGEGEQIWDYQDDRDVAGAVLDQDPSGEQFALEVTSRLAHQGYT